MCFSLFYFDSQIKGISGTDSSVLITEETGKDVLAEVIHRESSRAQGSFVKVNCEALPETLLESEFFGHQRWAVTGATDTKPGRFKLAHNVTLFLTEIGDPPLILQVKLLSFAGQGGRRRLLTGTLFANRSP
jgi:transcriptional regulator with GAF, ATPase, and Fis domain